MKIPVTICNVPSVKMSWADFQGILEIASLPEGPLKHKNVLISGISKHALSAARIQHDLPNMAMDEVVEFMLPDDTPAVRFVSHDSVLGDIGEMWFRRNGHVFQLSVSAPDRELQDLWVREIAADLTFPDDGPTSAATPQ